MSQTASLAPIALPQAEGEARWFLGGLTTIKASGEQTGGRVAVTENRAPRGYGSPLHVHHQEDEWFYVLAGELTFWVDGRVITATEGSFVYGPRDVPHTFTVASDEARFLLVVEPAGLDDFIRELSVPAESLTLPPASVQPPPMDAMMAAAAQHGIEIIGPPGIPT